MGVWVALDGSPPRRPLVAFVYRAQHWGDTSSIPVDTTVA